MINLDTLIALVSFGLTCFQIGYIFGCNKK